MPPGRPHIVFGSCSRRRCGGWTVGRRARRPPGGRWQPQGAERPRPTPALRRGPGAGGRRGPGCAAANSGGQSRRRGGHGRGGYKTGRGDQTPSGQGDGEGLESSYRGEHSAAGAARRESAGAGGRAGLGSVVAVWRSGSRREGAAIPAAFPGGCWPPSPRHSSLFTSAAGGPAPRRGTGRGPPGRALRDWGRSVAPRGLRCVRLALLSCDRLVEERGCELHLGRRARLESVRARGGLPAPGAPDPAPPLPADPPA